MADLAAGTVYIAAAGTDPGGDSWMPIGRTEGGVTLEVPAAAGTAEDLQGAIARLADWSVTVSVDITGFWSNDKWRWLHHLDRACYPRRHRRCHICHPRWSRSLAVNGHEYHRRQLARTKRRHR
jgi:hypothetical protein